MAQVLGTPMMLGPCGVAQVLGSPMAPVSLGGGTGPGDPCGTGSPVGGTGSEVPCGTGAPWDGTGHRVPSRCHGSRGPHGAVSPGDIPLALSTHPVGQVLVAPRHCRQCVPVGQCQVSPGLWQWGDSGLVPPCPGCPVLLQVCGWALPSPEEERPRPAVELRPAACPGGCPCPGPPAPPGTPGTP